MKKKLIYILMICGALFMTTACSEEYTDATSMHVYGPNENPPVKTDEKGTVTSTFDKKLAILFLLPLVSNNMKQ